MSNIKNRIEISTKQTLALTTDMRASLKILHMSTTDLREHIDGEILENPFLEVPNNELYYDNPYQNSGLGGLSTTDIIEQTADGSHSSISEYILEQINILDVNDNIKHIMQILISYIDDDGYIKTKQSIICRDNGFEPDELDLAWSMLKTFEPAGIASESLEECLITQLQRLSDSNKYKIIAIEMMQNFFDELSLGNFETIAAKLSVDVEHIEEAKNLIATLEPYPARSFDNDTIEYIVPELFIFQNNGVWSVKTNDYALPRLQINKKYTKLKERTKDEKALCYLEEQEKKAISLIKFIKERENTLQKVGLALLDLQREFFERGREFVAPMTLKDIAIHSEVNLSQSTISRLANKKYLQTVWGVFSLKYFFSSALSSKHSSQAVKEMIKDIISKSLVPISDEMIKNVLVSSGVDISRRTVAKYRNALNISASKSMKHRKSMK